MENQLPAETAQQRTRLLEALQKAPVTTLQARNGYDVLHPAARIQELRRKGYNIQTHRERVDTGKGLHTVAKYVLLTKDGAQ